MILHLINDDKFIPPFIGFLEKNFEDFSDRHEFWIATREERYLTRKETNIFYEEGMGQFSKWVRFVKKLYQAEKIILHGLFRPRHIQLLAIQPWLLKKCYWIIWGADLYYRNQDITESCRLDVKKNEFFRRVVIRNMGHLITYIEGDADLARAWYGARGEYHECMMYPSNLYHAYEDVISDEEPIGILVGNSADPSNNHFEILDAIKPYRNENIAIYTPLSYAVQSQSYVDSVIEYGMKHFGSNFFPLVDFMPFDEYLRLLGKIQIALFNHRRQQAMGNTISLLGMGKKVFMRKDVTPWDFFQSIGVEISDIAGMNLDEISEDAKEKNIFIVRALFTEENLVRQYDEIFNR